MEASSEECGPQSNVVAWGASCCDEPSGMGGPRSSAGAERASRDVTEERNEMLLKRHPCVLRV